MTESCWQLPRLSLGDEIFFKSLRCNFWPFAYNHKKQHGSRRIFFVRMTSQRSWSPLASLSRLWFAFLQRLTLCLLLHLITSTNMSVQEKSIPSSTMVKCSHFQRMSANQVVMQSVSLTWCIKSMFLHLKRQMVRMTCTGTSKRFMALLLLALQQPAV